METVQQPIITFYGPDGSGKSVIAHKASEILNESGQPSFILGSSDYPNWLTNEVCTRILGYNLPILDRLTRSEKTEFYEDLAIAGYLLSSEISGAGRAVLIDSDPYLKRLIWAASTNPDSFLEYADNFEAKVCEAIGSSIFPDFVVVVETSENNDSEVTFSRVVQRGVNTEYDPTSVEQSLAIHDASELVLNSIVLTRRYPRMENASVTTVQNFDIDKAQIDTALTQCANQAMRRAGF